MVANDSAYVEPKDFDKKAWVKAPLENRANFLFIGGCSTTELARQYDTPVYITDEDRIRDNYRRLKAAFEKAYPKTKLHYAIKCNNNINIVKILAEEGASFDCSSPYEIQIAQKVGATPDRILYTGNNHSDWELKFAADNKIKLNLDDISQLDRVVKYGKTPLISFRVNPAIEAGYHKELHFGSKDSKFGVIERDIINAYKKAKDYGFTNFGIHIMAGSGILEAEFFRNIAEKMMMLVEKIKKEVGIEFEFIDLGGGFGVPYKPTDKTLDIDRAAAGVAAILKKYGYSGDLYLEPGRYIVCDSTILLTRVNTVKKAYKNFVGTDSGFHVLARPFIYGAYHPILVANRLDARDEETYDVVGVVCESGDIMAKDRHLPRMREGDLLAILNAGAYGFSMSSQYNTRPRVAEVMVSKGKSRVIRKRETLEDLLRGQE
jgi:diaminopimelate decarboxylase